MNTIITGTTRAELITEIREKLEKVTKIEQSAWEEYNRIRDASGPDPLVTAKETWLDLSAQKTKLALTLSTLTNE